VANKRQNVKINYLSRDFTSIKSQLLEHARRYYPETFKDFSDAGFGALMIDAVSYVGDLLSFYVDYQANESFLSTAIEYDNIIKHGDAVGFKYDNVRATYGQVDLYIKIPVNSNNTGPDLSYAPKVRAGTTFSSTNGSLFTLLEDVDFADVTNEVVVATTNASTGVPVQFAIKTIGQVVSGELREKTFEIGNFSRFTTLTIFDGNVTEIISVFDSEGRQYYEVDHLSQNTIYIPINNSDATTNVQAPTIIKPFIVPRRFVRRRLGGTTEITFGYGSDSQLNTPSLAEARDLVLDLHSKTYVTDKAMDPTILIKGDKFGVGPSNTTLTVTYRANTKQNSNATAGSVNSVSSAEFQFASPDTLISTTAATVRGSLEVSNPLPIQGDVSAPTSRELRELISGAHSAQNRAVTAEDYKTLVLSMPAKFGGIKRCAVIQDVDSNLRNINIYVINQNNAGTFETTNTILKENIKTWLNTKRMINDSIDILDAKVVNLGIRFAAIVNNDENKSVIFSRIQGRMNDYFNEKLDIGESFSITDLYSLINRTRGVVDATYVQVLQQTGPGYATTKFNVKNNTTPDGRMVIAPKNVVFEVKFPQRDIKGTLT
jgi:hypothetical protein